MLLDLDFMTLDQSVEMSLNGLRRRAATHNKTQNGTQMDKPSVALYLGHQFSASGAHLLSFR
jgi:hypothetical protein